MEKIKTPITSRILIKASRETVFSKISTSTGWDEWFTHGTEFKLEQSFEGKIQWKDWGVGNYSGYAPIKVIDFKENEFVKFHWNYALDGGPTTVTLFLEEDERGTVLHINEEGFPATDQGMAMLVECSNGWGDAFRLLQVYIEHKITYH